MNIIDRIKEWLFAWQVAWLKDQSPWKVALKSRQIGWTEVSALEAFLHGLRHDVHFCFLVSTKVANARRQILDRIKNRWLPLFQEDPDLKALVEGVKVNKNSIELPNGSKLIATAHDPGRLRGNTDSSYWFDEFAFWASRIHEELVDAVWPQIDAFQNRASVVRIFSTPWTQHGNLFWEIWENHDQTHEAFSRHRVDIKQAVQRDPRFAFDIEAARRKYPKDKFEREYLCMFLTLGEMYFDRQELLARSLEGEPADQGSLYMGVDLGKTNDFTSIVCLRDGPERLEVQETYMMRSVSFKEQRQVIDQLISQHDPEQVNMDITAHQSFADNWEGTGSVYGLMGNRERKAENTMTLKNLVEEDQIRFAYQGAKLYDDGGFQPSPSRVLLDDLAKVQQSETPSGKQKFKVERDQSGHGDSYSALELALNAYNDHGIQVYV